MGPDSAGSTAKVRKVATSDSQTYSCQHSDRKVPSTRPETFCHRRAPIRPRQCYVSRSPESHQFGGSSQRHGWSAGSRSRCFEGGTSESQGSRTRTTSHRAVGFHREFHRKVPEANRGSGDQEGRRGRSLGASDATAEPMLAQASEPPVVGSGPESCSEVVALRARVAELECRQHGAVRRVTLWGMRGVRVGRLPTSVFVVSHGGPRSITGLGAAVPVERLVERKIPCF